MSAAGCGTPKRASISGKSCSSAPQLRSTVKKRDGNFSINARGLRHNGVPESAPEARRYSRSRDISRFGFAATTKSNRAAETRHAQHAQRILGEALAHMTQNTSAQIALTAIRIDQLAIAILRNGIDGKVAPRQILLESDVRRRVKYETAPATACLGARKGVLLVGLRMQKNREVAAHRTQTSASICSGATTTKSRSTTGRPNSSSRTEPPMR